MRGLGWGSVGGACFAPSRGSGRAGIDEGGVGQRHHISTTIKKICTLASWFYAAGVALWFVLHVWLGDSAWWLALISIFAPFLFVPLTLVLPIGLVYRKSVFWASVLPPLAIFLLLYGQLFLPNSPPRSATTAAPLTVMSFNIWGYSRSENTAHAILQDKAPDIVALQELAPEMVEILVKEVGDTYPYHAISIGIHGYGMGVFSRYPLMELDSSCPADSNWQVQILRVVRDDQSFVLYNVHLQVSNVIAYFEEGISVADRVEASFRNREAQARCLVADIATRVEPVILAGDFNSTDQSDTYGILAERLTDAHQAVGWGFGHTFPAYCGTWRGLPIIPRQMRLDMIFYSDDLTALSSRVSSIHGESDHLPVLVQLACRR